MGGCVSHTLATLVMLCHHESNWLNDWPDDFKPVLYRRCVDDIFILFWSESHIEPFFQYITTRHTRNKFSASQHQIMPRHFNMQLKLAIINIKFT